MRLEKQSKQIEPPCLVWRMSVDLWPCEHAVGDGGDTAELEASSSSSSS